MGNLQIVNYQREHLEHKNTDFYFDSYFETGSLNTFQPSRTSPVQRLIVTNSSHSFFIKLWTIDAPVQSWPFTAQQNLKKKKKTED